MTPNILPPETWKSHTQYFKAANGKIFATNLISKHKTSIKFFPSYTFWAHVIGTSLPDKDVLIGWDVYSQCKSLRILPAGIRYKRDFKPFSQIPKIFPLSEIQPHFQHIHFIRDFIPKVSHHTSRLSALLKKNPPLWDHSHSSAIAHLKQIAQSPPALTIPSTGQLILQTNASDRFWGAILTEEKLNHRGSQICYPEV
ncbi:hypothetical protein Dsin_023828 [Dipteronia sinensis]|uniref:Reverse transcriptase/retrotransposon-derived protein RNase H-like domain-containing protein n=1 Tax=Dipteronia sinensis TaxID=43782 RepID=A0AAE0A421_9ROSI|nr:hypothetical protein Dsin_023828 [Dipteronia sinensis]